MALIHASDYDPIVFPLNGDVAPGQIDRAQSIEPSTSLNREEINEIGRNENQGLVGYVKGSPEVPYAMTQYEYGSIDFWRKITNKADSVATLTLSDFRTATFDIGAYLTDVEGTALGTLLYPAMRTAGFSFSIGDPDAIIERSFDFIGESAKIFQSNNKYYIYERHEASSGSDDAIDLSTRAPVADPDVSAGATDEEKYIYRVLRVSSGTTTTLEATTDYTYSDGTKILTINSITTGDVIKVYYTSSSAPSILWTPNDADPVALRADSVDIFLYVPASGKPSSSDKVYRLQNVTVDVTFDRSDLKEIGNTEVVLRSIDNSTVSVTLGRFLDQFTVEEVLRGEATGYGVIDVEQFTDNASLIIKFYSDNSKATFKYGIRCDGLSPTDVNNSIAVTEHTNQENVLEGKSMTITTSTGELGI
jgi:hypothetical protein